MGGASTPERCGLRLKDLKGFLLASRDFRQVVEALRAGHAATIEGAWGSSSALVAAALGEAAPGTVAIVLPFVADVDDFRRDLESFSGQSVATFPAWEGLARGDLLEDSVASARLRLLSQLQQGAPPRFLVTCIQATLQPVPQPHWLSQQRRFLAPGSSVGLEALVRWLQETGYVRRDAVEVPGEYSLRGGILDIFAPDQDQPVRLEFWGDDVESIRTFDPETQRSTGQISGCWVTTVTWASKTCPCSFPEGHLTDYFSSSTWWLLVEPQDLREQGQAYLERLPSPKGFFTVEGSFNQILRFPTAYISSMPQSSHEITCSLKVLSIERFSGELSKVRGELEEAAPHEQVLIACSNEAEQARLREIFQDCKVWLQGRLHFAVGHVRAGFRLLYGPVSEDEQPQGRPGRMKSQVSETPSSWAGVIVLSDHELFHRTGLRRAVVRRRYAARAIDSFSDLQEGDYVVHVAHGIALYQGLQVLERRGAVEEHLVLEFAEGTRVLVPASQIHLVQKYVGGRGTVPPLSKIGTNHWEKRKLKVAAAVHDLAAEMLRLQAIRKSQPGISYAEETEWQLEFEASFPFEETQDQLRAMAEIKRDMAEPLPMDRLLCGDVGYGKTELAMRAAFKAVDHGKQVAVLVPTTVLAEQHYRTFTERMAAFPITIELLSRFRSKAEQQDVLERLAQGTVDIVIGTHRLLQPDVTFRDLGLVIIDEEQRFGVADKERLKKLRATVDVLTLTATPIPRTLHMALLGIRDISVLETPPPDRLAVETRICRWDPSLIRQAILRELNRQGQVFFVHNRIQDIHVIEQKLRQLVPEARIRIAHGQMPEEDLERTMLDFFDYRFDVLLSTTIIENGLDVPRANTLFVNEADRFGLADLHQLRGRVGRYKHRAYAYFLIDPDRPLTLDAAKRLKAIEEFSELGAGFKIALRDLEIRGAGNILGPQQSGHIAAVGYELYCQLLEQAIRELKREPAPPWIDTVIELPWKALLPKDYVPSHRQRIELYRRLGQVRSLEALEELRQELRDRFGSPPPATQHLLEAAELRVLAQPWQLESIRADGAFLRLKTQTPASFRLLKKRTRGQLRLVEDTEAYLPLEDHPVDVDHLVERLRQLLGPPPRSSSLKARSSSEPSWDN
jgi:transcription-repair coupling factor (superfamily II helicase)